MIKVKICGVTNTQDALWAANLGADFVGLNFYPQSPRKVSPKNAKDIAAGLPPFVQTFGVFVDEPVASIAKLVKSVPLKGVQLHGQETPTICQDIKNLGVKVMKVIRLKKPLEEADWKPFEAVVDYFLFDKYSDAAPGGTGETFAWDWLQGASAISKPWFLAGGLTPENIGEAMKAVKPFMVDVCSGVERLPTRKDFEAMKKFIQTVKAFR